MAVLNDSMWLDPKVAELSDRAFRMYVTGLCVASAAGSKGVLTRQQQLAFGATKRDRDGLVKATLWQRQPNANGNLGDNEASVSICNWDRYNGQREISREYERTRKAAQRARSRDPVPPDVPGDMSRTVPAGHSPVREVKRSEVLTAATTSTVDAAAADRLRGAGWGDGQIEIVHGMGILGAAVKWLERAEADRTIHNPGAFAYAKASRGELPEEREDTTIAPGAQGPRSQSAAKVACPICGVGLGGESALEDHLANVHWDAEEGSS